MARWLTAMAGKPDVSGDLEPVLARSPAAGGGEPYSGAPPEGRGDPAAADARSTPGDLRDGKGAGPESQPASGEGPDASDPTYLSSGSSQRPVFDPADESAAVTPSQPTTFSGLESGGQGARFGAPTGESAPDNGPSGPVASGPAIAAASVAPASAPPIAVNTAPTDIVVTGGSVDENNPGGTVVATLDAVDPDSGESFTFDLIGGDTDKFEIVGNQIVVRADADLDFETDTDHSVDVRVTDSAGNTYSETVDIAVQDVADATIQGTDATNWLFGGGDAENIQGLGGADKLIGGAGNDDMDGGSNNDRLYGGDGDDVMYGGDAANGKNVEAGGDDTLFGQAGDDQLDGGDGDDRLSGGDGDDVLIGGVGADDLEGDAGNDTASYEGSSAAVAVDLAAGAGTGGDAEGDTLTEIENLTGSDHDDTLTGDAGANVLTGGGGGDTLIGNAGDDTMYGGGGDDVFVGVDGNDTMFGEAGDDLFVLNDQDSSTNSWVDGGDGTDTVDLSSATDGWTVVLDNGATFSDDDAFDPDALSDDAGVVTFDDGAEVAFQNIENLIW
ncbi:MAG: cadherin domain-containing protein [Alphaproteobacteria bacterium]|nr:cadherin domain-containing protein [Alphaproteobacteria bacterium]